MYYAIALTGNKNYMLAAFNVEPERDTVVKYSNGFMPINTKQVKKYIDPEVLLLCKRKRNVVYNQDGVCCGKFESLYKPLHEQKLYRPESDVVLLTPNARSKAVINKTSAHMYK